MTFGKTKQVKTELLCLKETPEARSPERQAKIANLEYHYLIECHVSLWVSLAIHFLHRPQKWQVYLKQKDDRKQGLFGIDANTSWPFLNLFSEMLFSYGSAMLTRSIWTELTYFPTRLLFLELFYPCSQLLTKPRGCLFPRSTFSSSLL